MRNQTIGMTFLALSFAALAGSATAQSGAADQMKRPTTIELSFVR
jgi:hypothetical protein